MPGYQVREIEQAIGGHPYRLRVLSDTQQFADPDGHGERAGVSSATWSLFGQLWPSGALLAHAMDRFDIAGKRILELGCGIGLASLVLQRRGATVVATVFDVPVTVLLESGSRYPTVASLLTVDAAAAEVTRT